MINIKGMTLVVFSLIVIVVSLNTKAEAAVNFYGGLEVSLINKTSYTSADTSDIRKFKTNNTDTKLVVKQSKPGLNAFFGGRLNEYFGAELGYSMIQPAKGTGQPGEATNRVSNLYVDFLWYMPLASQLDLIISVGMGGLKSKASVIGASFQNLSALTRRKISYRAGLGTQYDFTDNWATRGMLRYQKGNPAFLRGDVSLSVGVVYTF